MIDIQTSRPRVDGRRSVQGTESPVAHLVVERRNDPTGTPRRPDLNLVAGHVGLEDLSHGEAEGRTRQTGVEVHDRAGALQKEQDNDCKSLHGVRPDQFEACPSVCLTAGTHCSVLNSLHQDPAATESVHLCTYRESSRGLAVCEREQIPSRPGSTLTDDHHAQARIGDDGARLRNVGRPFSPRPRAPRNPEAKSLVGHLLRMNVP